jgi:Phytanoyl-CoA dioxygenase (PhyH)
MLDLNRDGATRLHGAAIAVVPSIAALLGAVDVGRAGQWLRAPSALESLLASGGPIGGLAASVLGNAAQPVRAILFDKNPSASWSLGWHQDRTICVAERVDVPGFANWTLKAGRLHVEPPIELLERKVTMRVHLDPVPDTNEPLLIAPGTHRLGRIPEAAIAAAVAGRGIAACTADRGDVWLYATPILHASDRAIEPARRRVLQIDYAADALPGGLRWAGV